MCLWFVVHLFSFVQMHANVRSESFRKLVNVEKPLGATYTKGRLRLQRASQGRRGFLCTGVSNCRSRFCRTGSLDEIGRGAEETTGDLGR